MALKTFAPFHFGLVPAVSGKFHSGLRAEAADEAKKTSLGLPPFLCWAACCSPSWRSWAPLPGAPRQEEKVSRAENGL